MTAWERPHEPRLIRRRAKCTGIVITNPGTGYTTATASLLNGGYTTAATLGTVSLTANTSGGLTKTGTGTLTLSGANT